MSITTKTQILNKGEATRIENHSTTCRFATKQTSTQTLPITLNLIANMYIEHFGFKFTNCFREDVIANLLK